jgi:hypothetical protein
MVQLYVRWLRVFGVGCTPYDFQEFDQLTIVVAWVLWWLLHDCHLRHPVAVVKVFLCQPRIRVLGKEPHAVSHLEMLFVRLMVFLDEPLNPYKVSMQHILHRESPQLFISELLPWPPLVLLE